MDIINQIKPNILSRNVLKEIEILPMEFREKTEEFKFLQIELNELRSKYSKKEKEINKLSQDIIKEEDNLTINLEVISKIKSEQKLIINSLTEENFKRFKNNFYKIPNNYREVILLFLKYEGILKEELNFLLIKQENLQQLLRDSYSHFKSLVEFDKKKSESLREKIKSLLDEEKEKYVKESKSNKYKLESPFDIIIAFINNTFKVIDIIKYNKIINQNIKDKSNNKNNLFIQNKLLEETIREKEKKLKNINIYIKYINNILIKYQNYFGNSNKNNNENNSKSFINNRYDNIANNNIFVDNKKDNSYINYKLKSNANTLLKSNIITDENNEKLKNSINDKILLKSNLKMSNEEKIKTISNVNLSSMIRKKNNFYQAVNNCKSKGNLNINDSSTNNQMVNSSNIKIISIITNKDQQNLNTSNNISHNNNQYLNSNSIDNNINQKNISEINTKSGKKIKIGSLSMYQSSTSKKYKNKIIKTNSFEQIESKKIFIISPTKNRQQNKSYTEITNNFINKKKEKKKIINKYQDKDIIRANQRYFYSLNDNIKTEGNNYNYINANKIKTDKKVKEKKIIVDNIMTDSKQTVNYDNNLRKNFYLSPGIYSNNRKILKMFEMNKIKEQTKTKNNNK